MTVWRWISRSLRGQGHTSMWQRKAVGLSNIVFKYGVNPFNNKEVIANVKVFWQFDLEGQGHSGIKVIYLYGRQKLSAKSILCSSME